MSFGHRCVVVDLQARGEVWKRLCSAEVVTNFSNAYAAVGQETHALFIVKSDLLNPNEAAAVMSCCAYNSPACYVVVPHRLQLTSIFPEPDLQFHSVLDELLIIAVDLPTAIRRKAEGARNRFQSVLDDMLRLPFERLLEDYQRHFATIDRSWWLHHEEKLAHKRKIFEMIFLGLMEQRKRDETLALLPEFVEVGGSMRRLRELAAENDYTYLFGDT